MMNPIERRQSWSRIVGVERRSAPLGVLEGRPLPDPTRLEDEEFLEAKADLELQKRKGQDHFERRGGPFHFD